MGTQADHTPTAYEERFLKKAEAATCPMTTRTREPVRIVSLVPDEHSLHGVAVGSTTPALLPFRFTGKGSSVIFDFGEHLVGRAAFSFDVEDNPQDAPVKLRFSFGELPSELFYPTDDYDGWLSDTWFQEETRFLDATPSVLQLERRFSFRYLKVELLGISTKNSLVLEQVSCIQQSSAKELDISASRYPGILGTIDEISRRTLRDCMQDVFEDGPKRDRRLWLGDLRLQALANYESYRNHDLVKRCLYLFAGTRDINGRIASCLFTEPVVRPDTIYLFDYYLLFVPTLLEYYEASGDRETLEELYPVALRQIKLGRKQLGSIPDDESWWAFIDWHPDLDKRLPALGILIYCMEAGIRMAGILGDTETAEELEGLIGRSRNRADQSYDPLLGLYLSGTQRQASYASQIWMVLSGVADTDRAREILSRDLSTTCLSITTPYLMHYYVEALIKAGLREQAHEVIREFWGGMASLGADTFWEVYRPEDLYFSPYGSFLVNSYCHAWSCTPIWLLKQLM